MASANYATGQMQIKQEDLYTSFEGKVATDDEESTEDRGNGIEDTKHQVDCNGDDEDVILDQLITENKKLQEIFEKMNNRQTVLEEFIEVEYGDSFDKFMKNRERLVNVMGLEKKDTTTADFSFDGSRSAKSHELVNLLKVVKTQAATHNECSSDTSNPTGSHFQSGQQQQPGHSRYHPYDSSGGNKQSRRNRKYRGGGRGRH